MEEGASEEEGALTLRASRKAYSKAALAARSCWRRKSALRTSRKRLAWIVMEGGRWASWRVEMRAMMSLCDGHALADAAAGDAYQHENP